jgi:site-specific recombinase XerD
MELSKGNIVEDLCRWKDLYIQNRRDEGLAIRSVTIYSGVIDELVEYSRQHQDEVTLKDLNGFYINAFLNDKAAKSTKGFGNTSRKLYMNVVKGYFKFISENNIESVDLLYQLRNLKIKTEKKVKPAYTNEQEERILLTLEKLKNDLPKSRLRAFTTLRNLIMIKIFLNTGIRGNELARLRYDQMEPYTEEDSGLPMYRIKVTGKGSRERYVYIEREEIDEELELMRPRFGTDGLIAISATGQPLGPIQINQNVSRIAKMAGLSKGGNHIYRHTVARRQIRKGVNLELVRQNLGHSSISTTSEFYADTDESGKAAAVITSGRRNGKRR